MSNLNKSPEIVTQKELEPVLTNKTFDAKKFLELYEEWKQTHDTHTFAILRSLHEDAGYNNKNIIFGAEQEMHEIAEIIKNFQEGKNKIAANTVTATSSTAIDVAQNQGASQVSLAQSQESKNRLKYELKVYEGYAIQELKKSGKTVSELQQKLIEKKVYSGKINGNFDQATLDAVITFQKTIPNAKFGGDGLVGSMETIPALFGIVAKPNTGSVPHTEAHIEKTTKPVIKKPSQQQSGTPKIQTKPQVVVENVEATPTIANLTQAMEEFRKTYKAVNDKTNKVLPDHEQDIETRNKSIQQSAGPIVQILGSIDPSKLNEQERKTYESMKLEVAKYFSNELSGIKSRQYTDYGFAFSLAESIIAPILKESKITLPVAPTQDDIEKQLKKLNPSLHARYVESLAKGWTLGQFLSNPKIRAEWADVQGKINEEYEDKVQKKLAELVSNKAILKTPEQYEALNLMLTIIGSSNFLDFKKRNLDAWIQTGGAIGSAIGGGIAGVAIIGTTGWTGVGAVAGASVIGASIATLGGVLSRGRYDEKYLLTEGGINLATFGVAGTVGKIAKARYIDQGSKIAGYGLDGTAGLGLGVAGEYTRALTDGANFKDLPHGKMILMQLPWALLPMTMGGLAHLKRRSEKIQQSVSTIRSQANAEDHAGAARTTEAIAPEVEAVANAVKAQVQAEHAVTSSNPSTVQQPNVSRRSARVEPDTYAAGDTLSPIVTARIQQLEGFPAGKSHEISNGSVEGYIGKNPEGKFQFIRLDKQNEPKVFNTAKEAHDHMVHEGFRFKDEAHATAPTSPIPENASSVITPPVAPRTTTTPTPQMNEQQFTDWFAVLIPKVDKKKFPVGSTIKSEGVEITALDGGKYSMKHNGSVYDYDSHAELTANIGKIIKTPSERLALLKSTESNRIINHMQGYTGVEVSGVPGLRWKHDGHGKMSFERKNPENGSWSSVEIATLTPDEQLAAVAHWYKVKPSQILEGIKKSEGATAHDVVGHAEKEGFIKKHGLAAWHKVEEGFKNGKNGVVGAGKTAIGVPGNILSLVTNWGHGSTWGKSFAVGAITQGIGMTLSPFEKDQWRDNNGNINWSNAGEALAIVVIAANCGIPRAMLASASWGLYEFYTNSSLSKDAGAKIPVATN